jgi:hypothetical protein
MQWFSDWRLSQAFDQKSILEFHHKAGVGDPKIDVIMKREKVGTVSITQVTRKEKHLIMDYEPID